MMTTASVWPSNLSMSTTNPMGHYSSMGLENERRRLDSESSNDSDFAGLEDLMPLELEDLKPHRSLKSQGNTRYNDAKFFSIAMNIKSKSPSSNSTLNNERAKIHWKRALALIRTRSDPWEKFNLNDLATETCIRYRYNAMTKEWKEDRVFVKMESVSFNRGAMRECYRLKKQSNIFTNGDNWCSETNNYVAKRYMDSSVGRETYFVDVQLQMEAKLWGEEYNRHNPPKKVDIFQMCIIEFVDRTSRPLFHMEHFIEGTYIKYNSNSGYVDAKFCRQTPHAFSHFTFERSGHELIVVDIQGVGDLYTDPQIHTYLGDDYGDGNLGTKGMALFFHSHSCNMICKRLKLTPFDLTTKERNELETKASSSVTDTVLRGNELGLESSVSSESSYPKVPRRRRTFSDYFSAEDGSPPNSLIDDDVVAAAVSSCLNFKESTVEYSFKKRNRFFSECSEDSGIRIKNNDAFVELYNHKTRASCIQNTGGDSILGQIHLELAKYHEVCRFELEGVDDYDHPTAIFHLKTSADCGTLCSIISLARLHFDLPHDILTNAWADDSEEKYKIGFEYMVRAAEYRDRSSMVFVAHTYDYGYWNIPVNTELAVQWYTIIMEYDENSENSETDWGIDDPPYLILARLAEIFSTGFGSTPIPNPSTSALLYNKAAESATLCMKGKLANQYYLKSEEIASSSQVEI